MRRKVFAMYHGVGNAKEKERTELSDVLANAEWSRASKGTSKLGLKRQIKKGSFVHAKNRGVNMTRRFVKIVNADYPFFFIARIKSIKGKEVSLTCYREDRENQYVAKPDGEWSESIRSATLIDPGDVEIKKNVMSLSDEVRKEPHVVGHQKKSQLSV